MPCYGDDILAASKLPFEVAVTFPFVSLCNMIRRWFPFFNNPNMGIQKKTRTAFEGKTHTHKGLSHNSWTRTNGCFSFPTKQTPNRRHVSSLHPKTGSKDPSKIFPQQTGVPKQTKRGIPTRELGLCLSPKDKLCGSLQRVISCPNMLSAGGWLREGTDSWTEDSSRLPHSLSNSPYPPERKTPWVFRPVTLFLLRFSR